MIILVGPELSAEPAKQLGERLRKTVSTLDIANSESIAADHVTASVAVASGPIAASLDRMHLLTNAISTVRSAQAAGGNRVVEIAI
jgi:GGDEF domain-containing protein